MPTEAGIAEHRNRWDTAGPTGLGDARPGVLREVEHQRHPDRRSVATGAVGGSSPGLGEHTLNFEAARAPTEQRFSQLKPKYVAGLDELTAGPWRTPMNKIAIALVVVTTNIRAQQGDHRSSLRPESNDIRMRQLLRGPRPPTGADPTVQRTPNRRGQATTPGRHRAVCSQRKPWELPAPNRSSTACGVFAPSLSVPAVHHGRVAQGPPLHRPPRRTPSAARACPTKRLWRNLRKAVEPTVLLFRQPAHVNRSQCGARRTPDIEVVNQNLLVHGLFFVGSLCGEPNGPARIPQPYQLPSLRNRPPDSID